MPLSKSPNQFSDDDLITCGICHIEMENPRSLICLHTYCLGCLREWSKRSKNEIICPLCREPTPLPPDGVDGLRSNFFVTKLKDRKAASRQLIDKDIKIACTSCDVSDGNEAVARCLECDDFRCESCLKAHETVRLTKTHNVIKHRKHQHDHILVDTHVAPSLDSRDPHQLGGQGDLQGFEADDKDHAEEDAAKIDPGDSSSRIPDDEPTPITDVQASGLKYRLRQGRLTFKTVEGLKVRVYKGHITKQKVGAIVNAANEDLIHAGGVAGAIEKAAGPLMTTKCKLYIAKNGMLYPSKVMWTTSGNLWCSYIIHAVGPRWDDYKNKEECYETLKTTFLKCLQVAENKLYVAGIALPLISSGIFGMPLIPCIDAFYEVITKYSQTWSRDVNVLKEVNLVEKHSDTVKTIQEHIIQKIAGQGSRAVTRHLDPGRQDHSDIPRSRSDAKESSEGPRRLEGSRTDKPRSSHFLDRNLWTSSTGLPDRREQNDEIEDLVASNRTRMTHKDSTQTSLLYPGADDLGQTPEQAAETQKLLKNLLGVDDSGRRSREKSHRSRRTLSLDRKVQRKSKHKGSDLGGYGLHLDARMKQARLEDEVQKCSVCFTRRDLTNRKDCGHKLCQGHVYFYKSPCFFCKGKKGKVQKPVRSDEQRESRAVIRHLDSGRQDHSDIPRSIGDAKEFSEGSQHLEGSRTDDPRISSHYLNRNLGTSSTGLLDRRVQNDEIDETFASKRRTRMRHEGSTHTSTLYESTDDILGSARLSRPSQEINHDDRSRFRMQKFLSLPNLSPRDDDGYGVVKQPPNESLIQTILTQHESGGQTPEQDVETQKLLDNLPGGDDSGRRSREKSHRSIRTQSLDRKVQRKSKHKDTDLSGYDQQSDARRKQAKLEDEVQKCSVCFSRRYLTNRKDCEHKLCQGCYRLYLYKSACFYCKSKTGKAQKTARSDVQRGSRTVIRHLDLGSQDQSDIPSSRYNAIKSSEGSRHLEGSTTDDPRLSHYFDRNLGTSPPGLVDRKAQHDEIDDLNASKRITRMRHEGSTHTSTLYESTDDILGSARLSRPSQEMNDDDRSRFGIHKFSSLPNLSPRDDEGYGDHTAVNSRLPGDYGGVKENPSESLIQSILTQHESGGQTPEQAAETQKLLDNILGGDNSRRRSREKGHRSRRTHSLDMVHHASKVNDLDLTGYDQHSDARVKRPALTDDDLKMCSGCFSLRNLSKRKDCEHKLCTECSRLGLFKGLCRFCKRENAVKK